MLQPQKSMQIDGRGLRAITYNPTCQIKQTIGVKRQKSKKIQKLKSTVSQLLFSAQLSNSKSYIFWNTC